MFQYNTPIEQYTVKNKTVYVKRDDLFGQDPTPHLAKLQGIKKYVDKLDSQGVTCLGDLDTRISKSGWGLACACQGTGIKPLVFYPKLKNQTTLPPIQQKAQDLGAEDIPLQAMRTSAMYNRAKKMTESRGGTMLPMGLTLQETVEEVAGVIQTVPEELLKGTIVGGFHWDWDYLLRHGLWSFKTEYHTSQSLRCKLRDVKSKADKGDRETHHSIFFIPMYR